MRVLSLVLLALLLAGCTALPNQTKPAQDPLFGLCPQWQQGPGSQTGGFPMDASMPNATRDVGPAQATWGGHPLDLYRIVMTKINATGSVELRAYAADNRQLGLRDYRIDTGGQIVPVVNLTDSATGHEFDVFLSPVTQNGTAAPAPIHLGFTLQGDSADISYSITYHYKVCGTPNQ